MQPEALIQSAIKKNYSEIAFTEHIDFLEKNHHFIKTFPSYLKTLQNYKKKYTNMKILTGVEIGEIHRTNDECSQMLSNYKIDLLIGSIHILKNSKNISTPLDFELDNNLIKNYYEENLELCSTGNFHILGHLGIYKRYLRQSPDETKYLKIIKKIFSEIIKKDIALEINTSPLRKPLGKIIPEPKFIKLYKKMGGKLITLGSDTHALKDFDKHYSSVIKILEDLNIKNIFRLRNNSWVKFPLNQLLQETETKPPN